MRPRTPDEYGSILMHDPTGGIMFAELRSALGCLINAGGSLSQVNWITKEARTANLDQELEALAKIRERVMELICEVEMHPERFKGVGAGMSVVSGYPPDLEDF